MHDRARNLIVELGLQPHPEGGFYAESFRSETSVTTANGTRRSASTAIWFLLVRDVFSSWHRVSSDEVWHHYEGDPIELLLLEPDGSSVQRQILGPLGGATVPQVVVPAGWWQTARPRGDYALTGCTVAPGFEFEDFAFLRDHAPVVERLRTLDAQLTRFL